MTKNEYLMLNNGDEERARNFVKINRIERNRKEIFDYIILSEGKDDLVDQFKLLKEQNLPLKKYSKSIQNER